MKKITALILTMVMIFNIFAVSSVSADNGLVMDEAMMEKMEFLKILDIIPDYNELNADLTSRVTRAEFASVVAKMIGMEKYTGDIYYYDVPKNHWAYKEISYLTEQGIIGGYQNKLFAPDETLLMKDAYTVIIRALGLEMAAEISGGYPTGYASVASSAGISKGISSSGEMTLGAMFILLYNTMEANVMEIASFKGNELTYKVSEEDTYLSVYRNVYKVKGVMESVNGAGYSSVKSEKGYAYIDGCEYSCDVADTGFIGEEVEAFYEKKDDNDLPDSRKIIWLHRTGKTDTVSFTADNDVEFDKSSYELRYDGKNRTFKIDRGIKVVYNGAIVNNDLSSVFNRSRYDIKLVRSTGNIYDIAVVWSAENYLVKQADTVSGKMYDALSDGRTLSLNEDDYEYFMLRFDNGMSAELSDLEKNTVLSVYKSADDTYCEAVISTSAAEGTISQISKEDGRKYYCIDGKKYFAAVLTKTALGREPVINESVRLKLDVMGDVVYIESLDNAYLPGYIIKVKLDTASLNETLRIKYIDGNGTIKNVSCDSKLRIDGESIKDMYRAYELLSSDKGMFVLIKADAEGNLKGVDTPSTARGGSEDILKINIAETTITQYRNNMGTYFWDKGVAGPNTIIFYVPTDANFKNAKDSDFTVKNRYQIADNTDNLIMESYKTKDKVGFEEFVVVKTATSATVNNDVPILVESVTKCLNADDEIVEKLVGWQGREKLQLMSLPEYSFINNGIGEGDIICCYITPSGEVSDALIRYNYDKNNPTVSNGNASSDNSDLNAYPRYYTGYVNDVVDGVLKVGYNSKLDCDIILDPSFVPVMIYDSGKEKENRIYEGSVDDAITPDMSYSGSSLVFVNTVWIAPRCIVIYK